MNYRREIDGLRAIAVLAVILFHAGFEIYSGGFVGVDIFFVISGYLITSIILAELEQGKFSIISFYERRARRILPALFLVMLACIPVAWFSLLPNDMQSFSKSLIAVSTFVSNILFRHESGYFDVASELKPLLHTWSLSVEEQYYLIFPFLMVCFWQPCRKKILIILGVIFLISFSLAQWGSQAKPSSAYFLLLARGWELLVGSFAAFFLYRKNFSEFKESLGEIGGWIGFALILYSIFNHSKNTPYPGFFALVPTIGTLFIILFASQKTTLGKFLGNKVLVTLGLISYSAYLWHQPLFAFARHRSLTEPSHLIFFALCVLTFFLAFLTWKFIETPIRIKKYLNRKQIFQYALLGSVFFICIGLTGFYTNGLLIRSPNRLKALDLESRLAVNYGLNAECDGDFTESPYCQTSKDPEVLVWGDSYAMHLVDGLIASKPSIGVIQKTVSNCGPFLGIAPASTGYPRSWSEKCIAINDKVFEYIKKNHNIKYVVMSSPFNQYVGQDAKILTRQGNIVDGQKIAIEAMQLTIKRIKELKKIPVIFSPTPQSGEHIGNCLKKSVFFKTDKLLCEIKLSDSIARQYAVFDFIKNIERNTSVVWLQDFLCASGICKTSVNDILLYRDHEHLSHEGSAYLGKEMNFYSRLEKASRSNLH
jgi:peptidoglycan/LPS O-acetylase OafA/YrhL